MAVPSNYERSIAVQLNPDCIRDLLLYFEEHTNNRFSLCNAQKIANEINYDIDTVLYHIRQCDFHGFFVGYEANNSQYDFRIKDISPIAHEFLANIRQDTTWNGIKAVAKKVGSTSLDALVQISSNVIAEIIKSQFGLK